MMKLLAKDESILLSKSLSLPSDQNPVSAEWQKLGITLQENHSCEVEKILLMFLCDDVKFTGISVTITHD